MFQHDLLNYFLIGLGVGLFFQLIHDAVIRLKVVSEEELPDFTLRDHIILVAIWPIILLKVIAQLLSRK